MSGFCIGDLPLNGPIIMAPLAGIGTAAFRRIALEHHAALVVTPLICAEGLVRNDEKSWELARDVTGDYPRAVQIFGSDAWAMAEAAALLESRGESLIDLNFGCPSRRIISNGAGAALLRDPDRLLLIARSVVARVSIPVTAKIRLGWSRQRIIVPDVVKALEDSGIAAVTIHARTKTDSPATPPSWDYLGRAVKSVRIPVIGNGGIRSVEDAVAMYRDTGCSGVMIGRAAVGRPWLLHQAHEALTEGRIRPDPSWNERLNLALHHVAVQRSLDPGELDIQSARGVTSAYMSGISGARRIRPRIFKTETYGELSALIVEISGRITEESVHQGEEQ